MIRKISNLVYKQQKILANSYVLANLTQQVQITSAHKNLCRIPYYSFCLSKQLSEISKNIYNRKQIEYEDVLNLYTKENLEKLSWEQIVESVVVISQYTKVVESLDLAHHSQIKLGLQIFLKAIAEKNYKIQDYFELIASNYRVISHKEFRKYIEPIWKSVESQIDSLDINEVIKIGYLYLVPFLTEESKQDGLNPHLDLNFQILSRNAQKYKQQLEILHPDLSAYFCVLLKFAFLHAKDQKLQMSEDLEQLINLLTEKITEDINYYCPQKLYQIMDHVIFLSGSEYFEQVCIYFEKRLIEQDKEIQKQIESKNSTDKKDVIDFSKDVENRQPLYMNQWLDMCLDVYNQGRQNLELYEYALQKLKDLSESDMISLKRDYIPQIFFIFSKSKCLDAHILEKYKQYLLSYLPNYNQEQIAKIYFAYSYSDALDKLTFENILYYFETNPLDLNSLGIIFFTLATKSDDEFSDRIMDLLREEKIIYVLQADEQNCDSQFLLSFLYFIIKKSQLENQIYQSYILEKLKHQKGSSEEIQTLLVNILKILNENVIEVKENLHQDFKDYILKTYEENKGEMHEDVSQLLQQYFTSLGLNPK
ncbi:hypothetical protein TTHERM_01001440 (macronuclear) [Tetrahymena thermophila SB210]|uniref:Uncharacterized protein n=1 Tax=Tetrahymena thermophila (strain SB210) TaxID=312017 RepID=Q24HI0_TETTS|nr:hypothetical protein TTHERM_01001440 [Tetrahymena thermophila SB210]EAS07251.1 hypothetical protein TTHERM_01001440 [Tetrahymena thermophila SB210]|eukprot:XP_001027493.1 hypothetical protein TTHERM_01001440 [Tetrahymena thermophila SB210]